MHYPRENNSLGALVVGGSGTWFGPLKGKNETEESVSVQRDKKRVW